MSYYPDLATRTDVLHGAHVRAVGWLSAAHPFPTGASSGAFVQRLADFVARWDDSSRVLGLPDSMGMHDCELCRAFHGNGNFAVPLDDVLFVAPTMIHHYVVSHRYAPPAPFVEAILTAPLPDTDAYAADIERVLRRVVVS